MTKRVREATEGRLCGRCWKELAIGTEVQDVDGRHYHLDCEPLKDFSARLNAYATSQIVKASRQKGQRKS